MVRTLWPTAAYGGGGVSPPNHGVQRLWPSDEDLCAQYSMLSRCDGMAAAGVAGVPKFVMEVATTWVKADHVRVIPLCVNPGSTHFFLLYLFFLTVLLPCLCVPSGQAGKTGVGQGMDGG